MFNPLKLLTQTITLSSLKGTLLKSYIPLTFSLAKTIVSVKSFISTTLNIYTYYYDVLLIKLIQGLFRFISYEVICDNKVVNRLQIDPVLVNEANSNKYSYVPS